jgi:alpha-N-arabinofuranosidase
VWLPETGGIDPSLFFDDDGRAYIINNDAPIGDPLYEGHRALWVQEFDPNTLQLTGPRKMVINGGVDISQKPVWIEGPHFFRRNGQLYLIAAEGGTAVGHSQVVFKGESVFGPFTPYEKNPILTQRHLDPERNNPITSVGHADFVQDGEGNWWATFLGVRPYQTDFYNTGRETFLMPVRWEDGWPVITRDDELVPYRAPRPALPNQPAPAIPLSGNFTLREEFELKNLAPYWLFVRQPTAEPWHDLASEPGTLRIRARAQALGDYGRPSFVARRQQHMYAEASTAMHYRPARAGDRAGLAAFQSDDYFYFFGIEQREGGEPQIVVTRRAGGEDSVHGTPIASTPIQGSESAPLYLRIETRAGLYDFLYSLDGAQWTPLLEGADGKILSTRTAGGFVGSVFGLYAYRAAP